MDAVKEEKLLTLRDSNSDPSVVQPVAISYTGLRYRSSCKGRRIIETANLFFMEVKLAFCSQ
jgi:hypothetical protein